MVITDQDLVAIMERVRAVPTEYGWSLSRNKSTIEIEAVHHEIPDEIPEEKLEALTNELGAPPRAKLVVMWFEDHDGFEMRMARAIARVLSERFTVVLDDNYGSIEGMGPASIES